MAHRPGYRDVAPVVDIVTDDEVGEALSLLATTAHDHAVAKADAKYLEYMVGLTEARAGLASDERSADKRKWEARSSPEYARALELMRAADIRNFELQGLRDAATAKVEVWRTLQANQRAEGPGPRR
jgi:hypothetical protein